MNPFKFGQPVEGEYYLVRPELDRLITQFLSRGSSSPSRRKMDSLKMNTRKFLSLKILFEKKVFMISFKVLT